MPLERKEMLKKSVIIGGKHLTSISIEKEFFDELLKIATQREISINHLVTEIDYNKETTYNLSSAIRVYVLKNKPLS